MTDRAGDDQAEYASVGNAVRFRIGAGATFPPGPDRRFPDGGGVIAPGESFEVTFDVVVGALVPAATQILNTALLTSKDENGSTYIPVASAPTAVVVRGVPDVTIGTSRSGAFVRGQQATFSLTVANAGGRPSAGPVMLGDTLPAGLGIVSASGGGWTCDVDGTANSLHCTRGDVLAVGGAYPAVTVLVNVLESAPDTVVNTGFTAGGGETNLANDDDAEAVAVGSSADAAILEAVLPASSPAGAQVTYTLAVTNDGPSTAKAVNVSDPLAPGLAFVSASPAACGLAGSAVTCALGDLAAGQIVLITVVASVPAGTAKGARTSTATVTSSTPDSNLANNSDRATVTITAPPQSRLVVTKSASPKAVKRGGTVVFTITLRVPSKVDATQVDLCDTLPAGLAFVSAPGATFSKGRACWHLDVAKAGSTTAFRITTRVDANAKAGMIGDGVRVTG
jgi:uncharacterized repeat protein (TIGR01451 family)